MATRKKKVPEPAVSASGATGRRVVRLAQAAEYVGVPVSTMRDWVSKGKLPGWRLGERLIVVDLDDVDELYRPVPTVKRLPGRRASA